MAKQGWVGVLVLVLGGCFTEVDVDGEDSGVFFPSLRATLPVGDRPHAAGEAEPQVAADPGNRIEFEVTGGSGSDTQTLNAGDVINFEGLSLFGPSDVSVEWEIYTASALFRFAWPVAPTLRMDALAGMAGVYAAAEVSRGTESAEDSTFTLGPQFGVRLNWQPHKVVGAYGQGTLYWGFGSGGPTTLGAAELGATARVSRVTMFFVGWRWWSYSEDRSGSDLELDMSGPLLGASFDF